MIELTRSNHLSAFPTKVVESSNKNEITPAFGVSTPKYFVTL